MALDERLNEELRQSAARVQPDVDTALELVVETAAQRQRQRRAIGVALAAILLVGAGSASYWADVVHSGGATEPAKTGPTATLQTQPNPRDPGRGAGLTGEWQTAALPVQQVRSALDAAGVGADAADQVLGESRHWVVQLTFSTRLGVETWDPAQPIPSLQVSDDFVYRLDPQHHRMVITPLRPTTTWSLSYHLVGDRLRLHYVTSRGRPAPVQTARLVAWTASPFTLVR